MIVFDIETVPQPNLEALMPEDLRNPQAPDWITNPAPADLSKCPKYSGDEAKQSEWRKAAELKHAAKITAEREKWEQGTIDAKARFIENAALNAHTGQVKMIGMRDTDGGTGSVFVWDEDQAVLDSLDREACGAQVILQFKNEAEMIRDAVHFLRGLLVDGGSLITFYGNTFDFPFIARRASILGLPRVFQFFRQHRRGRYFNAEFIDLCDEWTMGDREVKTGGMDGLARTLGLDGKNGNGATFYREFAADPTEGLAYLLNDLKCCEEIARKMGIV